MIFYKVYASLLDQPAWKLLFKSTSQNLFKAIPQQCVYKAIKVNEEKTTRKQRKKKKKVDQ